MNKVGYQLRDFHVKRGKLFDIFRDNHGSLDPYLSELIYDKLVSTTINLYRTIYEDNR